MPTVSAGPRLTIDPTRARSDARSGDAVPPDEIAEADAALELRNVTVSYSAKPAVADISMRIQRNQVTALIGPSGCGKSTLLRSFNRMNDLIETAHVEGEILMGGVDILGPQIDAAELRRHVGMVFQKPNPFPKSIFENVAFGARINGYRGDMGELVERALRQAALWDEVADKLGESGLALSGGQQQRLCIARALAIQPDILLMDEPCSALDPVATLKIEDLISELAHEYTIVIVTHNMQQAARVSDRTAFLLAAEDRVGRLIEYGPTEQLFTNPRDDRTEDYVTGRFG